MATRIGVLFLAAACFAVFQGCVSADVYRIKEMEVLSLQKANADIQERNISLTAEQNRLEAQAAEMKKENEGLQDRSEKQEEEIAYVKNRAERLEKDSDELRERVEKLNAKISDLNKENQRLAALTRPENLLRTLGDRLEGLQKQIDSLSDENNKLKNNQAVARTEEEKTNRAEAKKTVKSAGEKPQAVRISAGQKTEDGKPDQQLLQDEREPRELSDAREKR